MAMSLLGRWSAHHWSGVVGLAQFVHGGDKTGHGNACVLLSEAV
jgi:hypothetical protein